LTGRSEERTRYPRIAHMGSVEGLRQRLYELGLAGTDHPSPIICDDEILPAPHSPLAQPIKVDGVTVGNRFCIQPMEGWDGTFDGNPSEHTFRRWRRFGESGAKLIWGGEAVAVRHEARANPNQLLAVPHTKSALASLLKELRNAHRARYGDTDDLLVGLQLTHSGRFCRPNEQQKLEPRIVYHHPLLDRKFGIPADHPLLQDSEIEAIVEDYARAARLAADVGFQFVDIKHCHGYLGHEFLSAFTREGPYGGSFENRTRFLRKIIEAVRSDAPALIIGVRISAFDIVPFRPDPLSGVGIPEDFSSCLPYYYGFGVNPHNPLEYDLGETFMLLDLLRNLGVRFVNITCGSPYYNPHIQRPALFPPSDGYYPPEDPLVGVARLIGVTRQLKEQFPDMILVGSAYTYLQEFLPHVAQHEVRERHVDFVGIGRMALSYPHLPADVLAGKPLDRKRICRTFSDCTTAPRMGLISGCYPLDEHYKQSEHAAKLRAAKKRWRQG